MKPRDLVRFAEAAGIELRVSRNGRLAVQPSPALTPAVTELLREHGPEIVLVLESAVNLPIKSELHPVTGPPWVSIPSAPSVVPPITCPTVALLHLTPEQTMEAARWAAVLDQLDAEQWDRFVEGSVVLKASVREGLFRRAKKARDNQLDAVPCREEEPCPPDRI